MQLIDSSVNLFRLLCFSARIPMLHVLLLSFGDRSAEQIVVTESQVTGQMNGSPSPVGGEGTVEDQADNHDAGDGTSNSDTDGAEEALFREEAIRYD